MDSGCGWLLNGGAKSSVADGKKGVSGSLSNYLQSTPARRSFGFPRTSRLTSEADLESLRRRGKRMQTECLEARMSASLSLCPRVGVVVPKFGQNIVDRNRTKRRLRELVRLHLLPTIGNVDLLIRAKPRAYTATFQDLALQVNAIADWASPATQD
jgi:ribonuclease P protein component